MPTGSGKSAVIGSVLADPGDALTGRPVLVLAPWRTLAKQLRADVQERVWTNLGVQRPAGLPRVVGVRSAADFVQSDHGPDAEPLIHVTTMAMALEIYKRVDLDPTEMGSLFANFAAVVVDECHYEPAPTWSEAVRATGLPTCLLTATPFRNDNRFFDLDEKARYRYSHADAVEDNVLRQPVFERLERGGSERDFVAGLLKRLRRLSPAKADRVIVRCGNRASVEAVVAALHNAGEKAVGFHETFEHSARDRGLWRSVPAPDDRPDVRFWVHQHKLTEGFDDPSVVVLAVYDGFGSDRARVQQIGRVLRNPSRTDNAKAWVLSPDDEMQRAWERYLTFDAGEAPRSMATDPAGVEALLAAQPETFYWERLFRERFDLHDESAWTHVKYRLSASLRLPHETPDLDVLAQMVRTDHVARDQRVLSIGAPNADSRVILYLSVGNSPVLRTGAFVEMTLGYTVLHWDGTRLFVSDSGSSVPESVRASSTPVDARSLVGLLPTGSRISDISLANNDLGQWSLRSRSLSAFDLGRIASEIGGSTYGYATAEGHLQIDGDRVSRYTGVRNARVTDRRKSEGSFGDLSDWFKEIGSALDEGQAPAAAIDRYATPVTPPADPKPAHVLLDVDPGNFEGIDGKSTLRIDSYGEEVSDDGTFRIVLNEEAVAVHIAWNSTTRRFELGSAARVPFRSVSGSRDVFWQDVVREQSIRVATTGGLVYTNGNFWSLASRDRGAALGLLSVLTEHDGLGAVLSEKGPVDAAGRWSRETAFGLLDLDLLPDALGSEATILCTDMGTEIADFVGFNDSKVILAHAKSKKADEASRISASALHEVVSQAIKNMKYLSVGNTDAPYTDTWARRWNGGPLGTADRLRLGHRSRQGSTYWKRVDAVVQSHATEREVWLVLGASLSKKALTAELKKATPKPVAVQVHALLNSAWSAAQQCGVRLRIYCSP